MIKRTVHIKSVEVFSGPCLLPSAMSSVFALATSADLIINQNKPPSGHLCVYCRAKYFLIQDTKTFPQSLYMEQKYSSKRPSILVFKGIWPKPLSRMQGMVFWYIVTCFVKMIQSEMEEAQP